MLNSPANFILSAAVVIAGIAIVGYVAFASGDDDKPNASAAGQPGTPTHTTTARASSNAQVDRSATPESGTPRPDSSATPGSSSQAQALASTGGGTGIDSIGGTGGESPQAAPTAVAQGGSDQSVSPTQPPAATSEPLPTSTSSPQATAVPTNVPAPTNTSVPPTTTAVSTSPPPQSDPAIMTLNPASAPEGKSVNVYIVLTGFVPNSSVEICLGSLGCSTIQVNASGNYSRSYTIPSSAAHGNHMLTASGAGKSVSRTFRFR